MICTDVSTAPAAVPGGARATCVIPVFHRAGALARLLSRLPHPDLEIVVVNIELDPEVAQVAAATVVVDFPVNVGFAAAVNAGVAAATAPVIVFMNDDLEMDAADVLQLVTSVEAGVDVVVPRVVGSDGHLERTISALPTPGRIAVEWLFLPDTPVPGLAGRLHVEKWREPEGPERVDVASAVVVAVRREPPEAGAAP